MGQVVLSVIDAEKQCMMNNIFLLNSLLLPVNVVKRDSTIDIFNGKGHNPVKHELCENYRKY
jgi:hypothetical protein